mgnify:CR=1 FL=1
MSDKDLVFRGDVKAFKQSFIYDGGYPDVKLVSAVTIEDIDSIQPVPHEMSARELFNAYQRICEEYSHKGIPVRCDECPLYSICPEIGRALRTMVIWSTIIEWWAREHPEEANHD